jgi:hypothetical protein
MVTCISGFDSAVTDPYQNQGKVVGRSYHARAALFVLQSKGHFELRSPKPNPIDDQSLRSRREEPVRNKGMSDCVSGSVNNEQKPPLESAISLRRVGRLWPWAWLAVTGVVTLGWLIAICWAGVELARWLTG